MVTYVHGKKASVVHGGVNLSPWMNEASATCSAQTGETSHFGEEAKTYIVGQNDATIKGSGLFDGTVGAIHPYMAAILQTEAAGGASVPILFAPEGLVIGATGLMALSKATQYEVKAIVSDVETVSFEMQANGGLTYGNVLGTAAAVTVTTLLPSVDNLVASSKGGTVNGHVLSNANTGNVTLTLQHSVDNSVWVDLAVLPVVTTGTLTAFRSATFAGTVNRYLRLTLTLAGTGAVSATATASRN